MASLGCFHEKTPVGRSLMRADRGFAYALLSIMYGQRLQFDDFLLNVSLKGLDVQDVVPLG